jgi:hypothetical protein
MTVGVPSVSASDDVYMLPISDALATQDAKDRLDGSVKFYFGDASHPAVQRTLGKFVTNQKTNGFLKTDLTACSWVFLSGLLEFQKKAQQVGANAVINIHSYYKKEDVSNETQIPCHKGALIAGIALRGDFVKIGGR